MDTEKLIITRKLLRLARLLLSKDKNYKYIYDPAHKKQPYGSGWIKTERGWSKSNGRKEKEHSGTGKDDRGIPRQEGTQGNRSKHSYQPTNEFKRVYRASLSLPNVESQAFHSGSKRLDENSLERLSGVLQRQLGSQFSRNRNRIQLLINPNTGKEKKFYSNVPGDLFHDVFEVCHPYLKNGDCVDIHEAQDYNNNQNYLSENGLSGISITKDGDLVSVFNLSNEGGFLKTIAPIVKEKCKTLDCFKVLNGAKGLPDLYEKAFNFKTASILDFNYDLLVQEKGKNYADHFVKTYGESPVHFMVNTDQEVETKHFNKDQWEDAYNYQQSIAFPEKKKSRMISSRRRIPWNMPLYVLYKRG